MKTSDFNYELPKELIAQTPLEKRDTSRLMTLDRKTGAWEHHHFYELPDFLEPGDCLILNDSRVLPARLLGQRLPGGGACEVLLLIDRGEKTWECLVRPGRHMREGTKLSFGNGELTAEVTEVLSDGNRLVRFDYEGIFLEVLEPCLPTSRRSSRTRSATRPSIPRSPAAQRPPRRGSTSRRSCWRPSGRRA